MTIEEPKRRTRFLKRIKGDTPLVFSTHPQPSTTSYMQEVDSAPTQTVRSKVESLLAGYEDVKPEQTHTTVKNEKVDKAETEVSSKDTRSKKTSDISQAESDVPKKAGRPKKVQTAEAIAAEEKPKRKYTRKAIQPAMSQVEEGAKAIAKSEQETEAIAKHKRGPGRPAKAASEEKATPKAKRGRPAKVKSEEVTASLETKPKAKRGRPAKVKNEEVTASLEATPKAKRGRPAKVEQPEMDYSEPQLDATDTDEITPVQKTKDYDQFQLSLVNRNIDFNHVRNLVDSIREKNLLASYPIIINSQNEVMDGQHRLEAAKMLNTTVYFKIDDNFKPENIARINTVSKKWALEAYLKHYMAKGNKQYESLNNFAIEFQVNIYSAIGLLSGRTAQPNNDLVTKFKSGEFVVRDYEGAIEVMNMRNDFAEIGGDFTKSKAFLNAISRLAKSPLYSHKKMMEKLDGQQRQFVKCNTVDQYLEMIGEIYNYHSRKPVTFSDISSKIGIEA